MTFARTEIAMDNFVDTSVLVAAYDVTDQFHPEAVALVSRVKWAAASHSLCEVFSTLTGKRKVQPDDAAAICNDIEASADLFDLTTADILAVVKSARSRGIRGGGIYDALIIQAAVKAGATTIWSFDQDFASLSQDVNVKTPK